MEEMLIRSQGQIFKKLEFFKKTTGKIVSIIGRYYSMDRDLNFDRTRKAYKLIVEVLEKNK